METVSIIATFVRRLNSQGSDYSICVVKRRKDQIDILPPEVKAKNKKNEGLFTVVGYSLPQFTRINIKWTGKWTVNKYGMQLQVQSYEIITPESIDGIRAFLASGKISSIGRFNAEKIIEHFGLDSLNVIENTPEKLLTIKGFGLKKVDKIAKSYKAITYLNKIGTYLGKFGITIDKSALVYNKFGKNSIEIVQNNPYSLAEVKGLGFLSAEKIAIETGQMLLSDTRIKEACKYVFESVKAQGNLYIEYEPFKKSVIDLLNTNSRDMIITEAIFSECFERLLEKMIFVKRLGNLIFSYETEQIERDLSQKIFDLSVKPEMNYSRKKKYLTELEVWKSKNKDIVLSEEQETAVITGLTSSISVITGGAGTGKTTVINAIISISQAVKADKEITLLAPTGKRSSRMTEVTGCKAYTIHKKLGLYAKSEEQSARKMLPENGVVIVDECSMIDAFTRLAMFQRNPTSSQIILVGDVNQLPSVGAGNVLREVIRSREVPVTKLSQIHRQSNGSSIVVNSQRINSGADKMIYDDSFVFEEEKNEKNLLEKIRELYTTEIGRVGIDNTIILSPVRKRGETSVNNLNRVIQDKLNPLMYGEISLTIDGNNFRNGDKVIQTKNTAELSNGDVGTISNITNLVDEDGIQKTVVTIDFGDTTVHYDKEDMKNVDLAYRLTIHKSQGSEYKSVIIRLRNSTPRVMQKRNLLYTAVTRSRDKCIILGDSDVFRKCISTSDISKRKTLMADRIHAHAEQMRQKKAV